MTIWATKNKLRCKSKKKEMIYLKNTVFWDRRSRWHFLSEKQLRWSPYSSHEHVTSHLHQDSIQTAFTNTSNAWSLCAVRDDGMCSKKSPCLRWEKELGGKEKDARDRRILTKPKLFGPRSSLVGSAHQFEMNRLEINGLVQLQLSGVSHNNLVQTYSLQKINWRSNC